MSRVRILLVDDHALIRAGIRVLLEAIEGVQIVGEADNGRDAIALARQHSPNLIVMDISMRELNGIESTEQIVAQLPATRVLILSMHAEEEFVRRAMRAGASGYLVKDSAPVELRMAIEALERGEIYLSSRISRHLVSAFVETGSGKGESSLEALSLRQREVLQMIAEGKATKEMAAVLGVSVKTVETHRAVLMSRLRIHDVAGLVMFAVRHRLVSIERP